MIEILRLDDGWVQEAANNPRFALSPDGELILMPAAIQAVGIEGGPGFTVALGRQDVLALRQFLAAAKPMRRRGGI